MSRTVQWRVLALALVALSIVATASATTCGILNQSCASPTVTVSTGGQNYTLDGNTVKNSNGQWLINYSAKQFANFSFTGGQLSSNTDPMLGFSGGFSNPTATPQNWLVDITAPFTGGPYGVAATFFVDRNLVTNGYTGTSTVSPNNQPFIMEPYVNGVQLSALANGTGCTATLGNPCSSPGPNFQQILYTSPASGTMELVFSFTEGPFSNYSVQGDLFLEPVPEPGSLMLLGTSVVGLAGFLRRKL